MKLASKLAVAVALAASASMAQATTYNVSAVFGDGGVQGVTTFDGSFDWDGSNVTNFSGLLSESMWEWNTTASMFSRTMMSGTTQYESVYTGQKDYETGIYSQGDAPLLALNYQVDNSLTVGTGLHAVTAFLQGSAGVADTHALTGGGYDASVYDTSTFENLSTYYGVAGSGETRNWNAAFSLVFDVTDPTNTSSVLNSMQYIDCNQLGMMGAACMTGVSANGMAGSMGGAPSTLSIQAVPVPGAVWLFGGALLSLFGVNRRKSILPA